MRKFLRNILLTMSLLIFLLPMQARATGRDGFKLDGGGTVTLVSPYAVQEGISSLGFSLSVEPSGAADVEFQFEGSLAEILEYRYDKDNRKLNVYVAGTEALFAEGTDSLKVGRVIVRDANGGETAAKVSVVENSLQYVCGTELKTMENIDLPGTVQIGPSTGTTPVPEPQEPDDSDSQEDDTPAASQTQPPVQSAGVTQKPQPTRTPARPQSTGGGQADQSQVVASESPKPSESSLPEKTPERTPEEEDGFIFSKSPEGEDAEQAEESEGVNVVLVIAVIVIAIVVVVEIVAFVVVKRKPKG